MFSLFKKKRFLSDADNKRIVEALKASEKLTSGEIRIFIEPRNPLVSTMDRAMSVFFELQMEKTQQRNAVLIYIAFKDKEVALFGDEGIHQQVGNEFWNQQVQMMIGLFKENNLADGIIKCMTALALVLVEKFPYQQGMDKNELPDEIVFGN